MKSEAEYLADLVEFARIEVASADVEPWAGVLAYLHSDGVLDSEQAHWAVCLYNTYDSLESAFVAFDRWPSPAAWGSAGDKNDCADLPIMQERRNLFGGRVIKRMQSYVDALAGMDQGPWLRQALTGQHQGRDFVRLTNWMRTVWGVGRQSAFEWAEFVQKVHRWPIDCDDAQLWESEGPRRSLQKLYGNPNPSRQWLDDTAHVCRDHLAASGVELEWVDFETIICDFNVGRDGRYYPGRHLAALTEEIDGVSEPWRAELRRAFNAVVPEPWRDIAPGIDPLKMPIYRDTGKLLDAP